MPISPVQPIVADCDWVKEWSRILAIPSKRPDHIRAIIFARIEAAHYVSVNTSANWYRIACTAYEAYRP